MEKQELEIISQLKSGDKKAFEKMFLEYYSRLSVFAKKYVKDLDLAKEIVQALFVKLYETHQKLNINTSLKSYLYSSVKNSCLNQIKQSKTHSDHIKSFDQRNKDQKLNFTDTMEQTELEHNIWQEISKLPFQCQRIFKMSRNEGKKNKEIADELQISIRTVETQISKGLKILRKNLRHYLTVLF